MRFWIINFVLLFATGIEAEKIIVDIISGNRSQIITLLPNSTTSIQAINVVSSITSVIFQTHAQEKNVTLSESPIPSLSTSVTGKNIGMTYFMKGSGSRAEMWAFNSDSKAVSVLLIIVPHVGSDLIPGGCNMEFPIRVAPYLHLYNDLYSVRLEYQCANFGSNRDENPHFCDYAVSDIRYEVYVSFLNENDFSKSSYFSGIENMSNVSYIMAHASKVRTHSVHPFTRNIFLKYPKVIAVYNIVAKSTVNGIVKEAAYVPSATYSCDLMTRDWECISVYAYKPFWWILSISGLFIAFCGHKFFEGEIFFFGFLIFSFVGYILFAKYGVWNEINVFTFSLLTGFAAALIWLLVWFVLCMPLLTLLPAGLALGFLITATILYTPLGNSETFMDDKNYWGLLACGSVAVSGTVFFPRFLRTVSASVVGSYIAILISDIYFGTSLMFIILNIARRAISKDLSLAINNYPFQTNDIVVSSIWFVLTVLSIVIRTCSAYYHCCGIGKNAVLFLPGHEPVFQRNVSSSHRNNLNEQRPLLMNQNSSTNYQTYNILPSALTADALLGIQSEPRNSNVLTNIVS